ncbi:hypothetical protein BHE74_00022499 [Ensete ventricosum]|nr:hypothetical protein GW17_00027319 [Ensete ventricosum]RWW69857.1 hypothetical protein BHE74_00022499 [Ensete ventricosum]
MLCSLEIITHLHIVVIFGLRNRFIHPNLIVQNGAVLARRLLSKELDPVTVLSMSPNELKVCLLFQTDGLTAQEKAPKEPEESKQLQVKLYALSFYLSGMQSD